MSQKPTFTLQVSVGTRGWKPSFTGLDDRRRWRGIVPTGSPEVKVPRGAGLW